MAKAIMSAVDLQPLDRLEEKVKLLVGMIDRLRADSAKASDDNARLTREVESQRARLQETEGTGPELVALREERDLIRTRVGEMLAQIDNLNL